MPLRVVPQSRENGEEYTGSNDTGKSPAPGDASFLEKAAEVVLSIQGKASPFRDHERDLK